MKTGPTGPKVQGSKGPNGPDEHLPGIFAGIVAIEILAIALLYWLGIHFA